MEYFFKENIPKENPNDGSIFWFQNFFSFGDQKRIATVTDVKVFQNMLIVAHRAAAKLYLMEKNNEKYNIIDTLVLKIEDKFFHPDLIDLHNNFIYMTSYTNKCCVVKIQDKKFIFDRIFVIHLKNVFHGIHISKDKIYFGAQKAAGNSTFLKIFKFNKKNFQKNITINFENRIKAIATYKEDKILLGCDNGRIMQNTFDSWIMFYKFKKDKLHLLESLKIKTAQLDGIIIWKDYFFVTIHSGITKTGIIVVGMINNNKMEILKNVICNDFPHGLTIHNDEFIYSSYDRSSIVIHPLNDIFLKDNIKTNSILDPIYNLF